MPLFHVRSRMFYPFALLVLLVAQRSDARLVEVPQDFATLKMAVDSTSSSDTIRLDSGNYQAPGFSGIVLWDSRVITSKYGASHTIIPPYGDGTCIVARDTVMTRSTAIEGITFVGFDRAIEYDTYRLLEIRGCNFRENYFGIYTMPPLYGSVTVDSCQFYANAVGVYWFTETYMNIQNCVFTYNGTAVWCHDCFASSFARNILAYNGIGLELQGGSPWSVCNNGIFYNTCGVRTWQMWFHWPFDSTGFTNNNVYGNDWNYADTDDQTGKWNNFSAYPNFCDSGLSILTVSSASPLLAANNPAHADIGGHAGIGCYNGDVDISGGVDIADVTTLIAYLYLSGPPPNPLVAGEIDCQSPTDIADLTYLISYLYLSGPVPYCH